MMNLKHVTQCNNTTQHSSNIVILCGLSRKFNEADNVLRSTFDRQKNLVDMKSAFYIDYRTVS